MERFRQLVLELNEELASGADPNQLRQLVGLLALELEKQGVSDSRQLGTAKVAVVLPPKPKVAPLVLFDEEFRVESLDPVAAPDTKDDYNVMEEVPTLYMQRQTDLNDRLQTDLPSLNDQWKPSASERMDTMREGPITDLRKAIGINERFQLIRELFRNDEVMYERSIKTINQFRIYPEADFWINRELKTKLGWPAEDPLVRLFDQLVRRRFSST